MKLVPNRRSRAATLVSVLAVLVFPLGLLVVLTTQATLKAEQRAEVAREADGTLEFLVASVRLQSALADESLVSVLRSSDGASALGRLGASSQAPGLGEGFASPEERTDAMLAAFVSGQEPFSQSDLDLARQTVELDYQRETFSRGFDALEIPLAREISKSLDEARRSASLLSDNGLVEALELLEIRVEAYLSSSRLMADLSAFWVADGMQEAIIRSSVTRSQARLEGALDQVREDQRFTTVTPVLEAQGFDRRVADVIIGGSSPLRNEAEVPQSNTEAFIAADLTQGFERMNSLAELSVDTAATVNDLFEDRRRSTQRTKVLNLSTAGFATVASLGTAAWFARSIVTAATRRDELEDKLFAQATVDHLTSLPNRRSAMKRLRELVKSRQASAGNPAVVFVDLDRFKRVNDTLGHNIGDRLLVQVATRLKAAARNQDTVARLGGDEFIVVVEECEDIGEVIAIAERIVDALSAEYRIGDHDLSIGASAGIAFGDNGQSVEVLLYQADVALYNAKTPNGDGNVSAYTGELQVRTEATAGIENDLDASLDSGVGLEVHYQPVIGTCGSMVGFEALIRWERDGAGMVPPDVFIPVAEKSSLITKLDRWVVSQALRDLSTLRDVTGNQELTAAVNFSGRHVVERGFVDHIVEALEAAELTADALVVEVTETVLVIDIDAAAKNLAEVRALGARVSIDDFGTGFTSINQLLKFPADELKLDRSLVIDEGDGADHLAPLVVQMANTLQLKTVAEGIETEESAAAMRAIGCDYLQGYHFARPMDFRSLLEWVKVDPRSQVEVSADSVVV